MYIYTYKWVGFNLCVFFENEKLFGLYLLRIVFCVLQLFGGLGFFILYCIFDCRVSFRSIEFVFFKFFSSGWQSFVFLIKVLGNEDDVDVVDGIVVFLS